MSTGTPSFFLPFLPNSGDRGDRRNGDLFLSFVPDGTRKFVEDGTPREGGTSRASSRANVGLGCGD